MALIRPIGKSTKVACFEKEAIEGVYVTPTKEIPFKSCDIKKTMKTEEDSSNIGEVFTTDLITMGYDLQGNLETNVYPETIGNILYFTLGKDTIRNLIKGVVTLKYIGTQKRCQYKIYETEAPIKKKLLIETYNGTTWSTLLDTEIGNKTLAQIKSGIETLTNEILVYVEGTGTGAEIPTMAEPKTIYKNGESITALLFAYSNSSAGKSHNIYPSNSVLDGIPSFSMLVDKNYGAGKCFGYAGCKINTLSLSMAVKTFIGASMSLRAKEEWNDKTDTSSDFEMTSPYVTNNVKILIDGVEFTEIKDLKLDFNNNMYIDEAVGVATYNKQDRQGATINVSGTANLTVEDGNRQATQILNEKYVNNIPLDMLLILDTTTSIDADVRYKTYIYIPKIKLSDGTTSIGGAERLTLSFAGQVVKNNLTDRHIDIFVNNKLLTSY